MPAVHRNALVPYTPHDMYRLVADVASAIGDIRTGAPEDEGVEMGPIITEAQFQRVSEQGPPVDIDAGSPGEASETE